MRGKIGGLIIVLILFGAFAAFATHSIAYRWESPRVSMIHSDVVGTPIPPSYGFWANMNDLGHKFRLAQGFMETEYSGLIGEKLNIRVSIYGLGHDPPQMLLEGEHSSAVISPPFTDEQFVYALHQMTSQEETIVPEVLAEEDEELAYETLAEFPDEGFAIFSPDGKRVAYRSWRETDVDIYTRSVDIDIQRRLGATMIGEPAQIAYTHSVFGLPQWSPDGSMIAYIADGRPAVADLASSAVFLEGPEKAISDIKWSPDGQLLAVIVSAQEDNIKVAGNVMILDPARTAPPISLRDRIDVFERGFFEAKTLWSPNANLLAVAFNLDGIRLAWNDEAVGESQAIIYVMDTEILETQSVMLGGSVEDWAWDVESEKLLVSYRIGGEYALVILDEDAMQFANVHSSSREILIIGVTQTHAILLDGDALTALDFETGDMHEISEVELEIIDLPPGRYSGFSGVETELVTANEPGISVITLKYQDARQLFGLQDSVIRKDNRMIIIARQGTIPDNLANLAAEFEAVHLDWSPQSGWLALTSGERGTHVLTLADFSKAPGAYKNNVGILPWTGFVVILAIIAFLILFFRRKRLSSK